MAGVLGAAPGIILGVGLGGAASIAIEPQLEPSRQKSWSDNPFRVLAPAQYAALVAQGAVDLTTGQGLAKLNGYDASRFDSLVYLAQRAPTHSEAQDLRRRKRITAEQLRHTFAKEQIEEQYWDALAELVDDRLSAQAVALGIIRSMLPDPGFFPVKLDTSGGVVPAYPVSNIDPIAEAEAHGFNAERLRVMVGSIGRPPGPGELARATFRNLIKRPDFNRGILEGDTRPEWAQTFLDVNREILTAGQYAELQLRGFLTAEQRTALTDQHGMSAANSDLLYDLLGRSIPEHQIVTGEARGGVFEGPIDTIPKAYLQSLQRGNLRPEYYNLAYANRYSMPSAFVFRALLTDGAITQAEGEQYFLEIGWPPTLAKQVSEAYAQTGTVAKLNPVVKAQQTKLLTAMHKASVKTGVPRTELEPYLEPIVTDLADRDAIFQLWADERTIDGMAGA